MKHRKAIKILVAIIVLIAIYATSKGIFSTERSGPYEYTSIRNTSVIIYGKGLYKDMSAQVAPQGIAQDYVTLFMAVPLLLFSLSHALRGSIKGRYLLAGTLLYFLVTYLFYAVMAMYNELFIGYVVLMGASFYAIMLTLLSFNINMLHNLFTNATKVKFTGSFLIVVSVAIALLWLSIVISPLLDGSIIPKEAEHYTTLIVQALDLGILLPGAFICGLLWIKRSALGYLLAPVYYVFLSILMCALTAKVIAMYTLGYNVVPVVFIIPAFNLVSILCTLVVFKNIRRHSIEIKKDSHEKVFT